MMGSVRLRESGPAAAEDRGREGVLKELDRSSEKLV
jgi:hypothetical protein